VTRAAPTARSSGAPSARPAGSHKACAKRAWRMHKLFCTDDPALKPYVPIEMAIERALAKILKTEEVPDDAVCYICLDREGPDASALPLRGCACRGPSGWVHADCLAEMAKRDDVLTIEGRGRINRWSTCATCLQVFNGALMLEMDRRRWREDRDFCRAQLDLSEALLCREEFDVSERLYEEARRGVASHDPIYHPHILPAEVVRARALLQVGRSRDALEILTRIRPMMELRADRARVEYVKVMSAVLTELGRFSEALPFAATAVDVARFFFGPQSQEALDAMFVQSQLFARVGRVDEAKATLVHVLAAHKRLFGPEHEHTRKTQDVLRCIEAWTA